jgi:hypothetical protein
MESMPRRMMGTASLVPKAQRRKMAKVRHYRWAQRLPISKARKNVWHLGSLWTMPASRVAQGSRSARLARARWRAGRQPHG